MLPHALAERSEVLIRRCRQIDDHVVGGVQHAFGEDESRGREHDLEVDAPQLRKGAKERPAGALGVRRCDRKGLVEHLGSVALAGEQQDVPRLLEHAGAHPGHVVVRLEPVDRREQARVERVEIGQVLTRIHSWVHDRTEAWEGNGAEVGEDLRHGSPRFPVVVMRAGPRRPAGRALPHVAPASSRALTLAPQVAGGDLSRLVERVDPRGLRAKHGYSCGALGARTKVRLVCRWYPRRGSGA